jgi:hypothetical protein
MSQARALKNLRVPGDKRPEGERPWMPGDTAPNPNDTGKGKMKKAVTKIASQSAELKKTVKPMKESAPSSSSAKEFINVVERERDAVKISSNASSSSVISAGAAGGPAFASSASTASIISSGPSGGTAARASRNSVTIVHPEGPVVGIIDPGGPGVDVQSPQRRSQSKTYAPGSLVSAAPALEMTINSVSSSSSPPISPIQMSSQKRDSNPDLGNVLRVTQGTVPNVEASLPGQAPCTPQARPDPAAKSSPPSSTSIVSATTDRYAHDRPPEDLKLNIQPLPID